MPNNKNQQSTQSVREIHAEQTHTITKTMVRKPPDAPQDEKNSQDDTKQGASQEIGLKSFLRQQEQILKKFIRETGENIEKSFPR